MLTYPQWLARRQRRQLWLRRVGIPAAVFLAMVVAWIGVRAVLGAAP